jgi:DNA polymerase-3 subunit delta
MKLQAYKVDDFIAGLKPATAPALILVYGPDEGGVSENVKAIKANYLGRDFDPLQYVDMADMSLSGQPGHLSDEAAAMPMFGDTKLVHVTGGGGAVPEAARLYLAGLQGSGSGKGPQASLVVISAGNLKPSAALRKLAEKEASAMALPCYALEARDITKLARGVLEKEHYRIDAQALDMLTARLATDRGIIQRELERLVLYKGPRQKADGPGMVTAEDIEAALGDQTQAGFDRLIDNVALGRLDAADRALARLAEAGTLAAFSLGPVRTHFKNQHLALGLMEKGTPQNQALAAFKPPLHFRRKPLVEEQMRLWSSRKAARALSILNEAEKLSRGGAGALSHAQAGQALLRIARAARL